MSNFEDISHQLAFATRNMREFLASTFPECSKWEVIISASQKIPSVMEVAYPVGGIQGTVRFSRERPLSKYGTYQPPFYRDVPFNRIVRRVEPQPPHTVNTNETKLKRKRADYMNRKRAEWVSKGLCRKCGKDKPPSRSRCEKCTKWERENTAKNWTPEKSAAFLKKRRDNKQMHLASILRGRLRMALKMDFKSGLAISALGCTIPHLRRFLEDQFKPGMTWENYGRGFERWGIDHICPLSSFDLTDSSEVSISCHYSNLQPMWNSDNSSKGTKANDSYEALAALDKLREGQG